MAALPDFMCIVAGAEMAKYRIGELSGGKPSIEKEVSLEAWWLQDEIWENGVDSWRREYL